LSEQRAREAAARATSYAARAGAYDAAARTYASAYAADDALGLGEEYPSVLDDQQGADTTAVADDAAATGVVGEYGAADAADRAQQDAVRSREEYAQAAREVASAQIDVRCAQAQCEHRRQDVARERPLTSPDQIMAAATHDDLVDALRRAHRKLALHANTSETLYSHSEAQNAMIQRLAFRHKAAEARAQAAEEQAKEARAELERHRSVDPMQEERSKAYIQATKERAEAEAAARVAAEKKAAREAVHSAHRRFEQARAALEQASQDQEERHRADLARVQRAWEEDVARFTRKALLRDSARGGTDALAASSAQERSMDELRRRHERERVELRQAAERQIEQASKAHQEVRGAAEARVAAVEKMAQEQLQHIRVSASKSGAASAREAHARAQQSLAERLA